MKLGLVGCGQMGRLVETLALERGDEIAVRFDRSHPLRAGAETRQLLEGVEVLVDFSVAEAVPETVSAAAELSQNLVIGTTGWSDRLDEVRATIEHADIGVVYAPNFSLGVHLFNRIVAAAAACVSSFEEYGTFLQESHHSGKRDRPSGTALHLLETLRASYGDSEIPVTSLRAGRIPGTHTVGFDSEADSIRLEHVARSRHGFAEGALRAARWVAGRRGFHGLDQVIGQVLDGRPAGGAN